MCGTRLAEVDEATSYCDSCGSPLGEWQAYCTKCGAPTDKADTIPPPLETQPARRAVVCPACGRPTGTSGDVCRWCGASLTGLEPEETEARRFLPLNRRWLVAGLIAAVVIAAAPWLIFGLGGGPTVELLNPPGGGAIARHSGDVVHIHGFVAGVPDQAVVSVVIGDETVWEATHRSGEPPPVPFSSWTAEETGTFTVTLQVSDPDGETTSDTATLNVT